MRLTSSLYARILKRVFDLLAGILLLFLLSPLLAVTALLVKATSPGPVLFSQTRAGRMGAPFVAYKFRSMRGGRVPDATELVPLDHPEITTVGRWIRRFKIDELPQLLNLVRGDMSLVGPRPTLPDQAAAYNQGQRRRLEVRPGLTGLAQVHGNAALSWDERIEWDVWYVDHISFTLDLWILWRTVLTIINGEEQYIKRFDPEFRR